MSLEQTFPQLLKDWVEKSLSAGTGANRNTLKLRLRELVASGRIRRHGKGRATWYSL